MEDVAILGYGPVGALLANLLGQAGLRVAVYERETEIFPLPRAVHFDGEAMRIFQSAGLAERIAGVARPSSQGMYFVNADGRTLMVRRGIEGRGPQGWPNNWYFHQPLLEQILRDGAARFPNVTVHLGCEILDVADLKARHVVGCDGARSLVRKAIGGRPRDLGLHQPWLVVDLLVNERGLAKLPKVSIQYCEPARPSTYLIGVGAHRRWELMLNPGEEPDVWQLLARWLEPGDAQLWRAASYRFHALVAREWRRDRVFLAGDAAHQQPPFTGQGMCQGIRDVANLSWKLDYVLSGKAGPGILGTYELERKAHVERLTHVIKDLGRVICERDPQAARARDRRLLAEAGGQVTTVPRQNLIPPLEGGFRSPHPHSANGTLFPKDGKGGMRVVVRSPENPPYLQAWFERHHALAA
ncbi:MAG TPA: FAD-dependent monooxygenase, partial [Reyranella sp.]|nr:FAD-dependent monooxygenase [Reyranella sp.]